MTDDEAFVRAVVDAPGDDTPRLVYADWLDDRSDPRGAYLRTEAEWAKPWRSGERPADSPELRELARGLDPVWVARVSRPPVGVCADNLDFGLCQVVTGPRLTPSDINVFERRRRVTLPAEYRAFLLNWNGGEPYPGDLPDPAGGNPVDVCFCMMPCPRRTEWDSGFAPAPKVLGKPWDDPQYGRVLDIAANEWEVGLSIG